MKRDDWIALALIAVLAYALYLGSGGTMRRAASPRRALPTERHASIQEPTCVRLWRAFSRACAIVLLLAAYPFAVALVRARIALRCARRQWGR